jgi:uncharacterized protein (TIGR02646 family)
VTWLADFVADRKNATKRYRYRDPAIKEVLRQETGWKCVYCESKIGHNTAGDIEHKVPTSKDETKHFTWDNLTVACGECNRRKRDYYSTADAFLDPYADNVEAMLIHTGPLVVWQIGEARAEITIKKLELHDESRAPLVSRKVEQLNNFVHLLERFQAAVGVMKHLLWKDVTTKVSRNAEYSGMLTTFLNSTNLQAP